MFIDLFLFESTLLIDTGIAIISYALLIHYIVKKDIAKTSLYLTVTLFTTSLLMFYSGTYIDDNSYIWTLFSPIVIYYLMGYKKGFVWVAALIVVITVFFLLATFDLLPKVLDESALLQGYLSLLTFSMISHFFQKMNYQSFETQKHEGNKEIDLLQERLKLAVEAANQSIWDWDVHKKEFYLSPKWKELIGFADDEIENTNEAWESRVHPDDLPDVIQAIKDNLDGKTEFYENVHRLKHKDGHWIWILDRGKTLFDQNGNATRMIGTHTDITERKKIEIELQQKTEELTQAKTELIRNNELLAKATEKAVVASNAKSTFLANMSHEMRTPLNAVIGFVDLLSHKEQDPTKLNYLHTINHSSHTLLDTINQILHFSKIESGELPVSKSDFNAYEEFSSHIELFKIKAAEKKINLTFKYEKSIPEVLHSDSIKIKQVIGHLLSNAIKFTPEHGDITIHIGYHKDTLYVEIKDNGLGIEKEKLEDILDSFSQADNSATREYGGTGLGLTISSKIIKMLGGELQVDTQIGKGSRFYFSLPIELGKINKDTSSVSSPKPLHGKVLIVEDIITNQMFISLLLDECKLEYDVVNNGIEAVEKFKANRYDLILMDENMPKLSGIGASKQIMQIEKEMKLPHTPIIAVTANAMAGDREKFLDTGMDDYISKPVERDVLFPILEKYLSNQ